jgi:hypothetical protein
MTDNTLDDRHQVIVIAQMTHTVFNNISFIKEINFIGAEKWSTRERKTSTFHKYLKKSDLCLQKESLQ